jgi:hypothetical protein
MSFKQKKGRSIMWWWRLTLQKYIWMLQKFNFGVRVFGMIPEPDVLHPPEMQTRSQMSVKWCQEIVTGLSEWWRIRQILHKDLRKGKICAKFFSHRHADEQKRRRLTLRRNAIQTCQDIPSFLGFSFTFLRFKLSSKERAFKMLKAKRKKRDKGIGNFSFLGHCRLLSETS